MSTEVSREQRRHQLYEDAHRVFSADGADELMDSLPPAGWGDIATKAEVASLREHVDAQGTALRGEMAMLRGDLHGEVAMLRGDLRSEMAKLNVDLRVEMSDLKSELLRWMVGLMFTMTGVFGGIVFAAVHH